MALGDVSEPALFAVHRCERRGKVSCSPWVVAGIGTPVATGVAGFPGLAIVSVALVGEARGGWGERGSTRVSYDVRGGSCGTVWTAALSFGTGTGAQSRPNPVDVLTEETEELFFWLVEGIVPTPV